VEGNFPAFEVSQDTDNPGYDRITLAIDSGKLSEFHYPNLLTVSLN